MITRQFKNLNVSALGYGIMRMPCVIKEGEKTGPIDEAKSLALIDRAYKSGVNFYDTSYFYQNGDSERFIGEALSRYPRDTWYLASKFPGNMAKKTDSGWEVSGMGLPPFAFTHPSEVFEYQLKQCGVDYFDFYMLHNVAENTFNTYTNEELGVINYLVSQTKLGRIRHLGFSSHGQAALIEKFLKMYDCFEFAMIQLNYLDWNVQDAGRKYDILTKHGLAVVVMEPLRGGKLAKEFDGMDELRKTNPLDSPAKWAFRHLLSLPNVLCAVSGMSNMEVLEENIAIFSKDNPLTPTETNALAQVASNANEDAVPCTLCRYCCDACPKGLDIPSLLTMYNEAGYEFSWNLNAALRNLKEHERPNVCTACGICNAPCPQNINIGEVLGKFCKMLADREKK